jgi:hypothetical protein
MAGSIVNRFRNMLGRSPEDVLVNASCREFEVNKWVLSEFILRGLVPIVGIHPFPLDELLLMTGAVCRCRPRHVFEWGTNIGTSARIFYETARRFRLETEIHSIDLPDDADHVEHPASDGQLVRAGRTSICTRGRSGSVLPLSRNCPGHVPAFFPRWDHAYESFSRSERDQEKRPERPFASTIFPSFVRLGYNTGHGGPSKRPEGFPGRYAASRPRPACPE